MINILKKNEYLLFFLVLFISFFGIINLFSASSLYAIRTYDDSLFLVKKQIAFMLTGIIICIILSFVNWKLLEITSIYIYLISLLLVIITVTLGTISRGSMRWLTFSGLTFQPSEIMKIGIILFLSSHIKKNLYKINDKNFFFKTLFIGLIPSIIVSINNLSTGIIIFLITICILFISSKKIIFFLILFSLFVFFYIFAYDIAYIIENTGIIKGYQLGRIFAWKRPNEHTETMFQTLQGLYAIGSGGIFGRGLFESIQKSILPEVQNDMIFAIICEELGVAGGILLLFLYLLMICRIFFISYRQIDLFAKFITFGIGMHFAMQVIFNIFVVTNLFPNTGVNLPFVSYGGSSILSSFIEIGIVMNVSRESM